MQITLKKSESKLFDGEHRYYHNNLSINDWKRDMENVDAIQKITLRLCEIYLTEANEGKAPEERLFTQNTFLMTEHLKVEGDDPILLYEYSRETVQKVLRQLVELGVIKHMLYHDLDGNTYKWTGGTREQWQTQMNGVTERSIVLDIKKAKELFAITHNSKQFKESKAKGRLRRFVYRRPFSLKEFGLELEKQARADRKDKVQTIREKRNSGYDRYLMIQFKKFGNFSITDENSIDVRVFEVASAADDIREIYNSIYEVPDKMDITS